MEIPLFDILFYFITYIILDKIIDYIFENDQGLNARANSRFGAQHKLVKLPSGLRRALRTLIKLQRYIGYNFKYKHLTNGRIEGLNNKIKVLKRIAYGYRNFQNFRTRVLMMNKLY